MRMKIICFYTGHYAWDAEQLTKSLNKTGWKDFCVENREPLGNWETNTQYKAPFILEKIKNEDSVVWTDADSRMKQYPSLLEELKCDVAFNYMPLEKESFFKLPKHAILTNEIVEQEGFLQSGTMYFKNTEKTIELLHKWIELNNKDNQQWDQWTLQMAVHMIPDINVYSLPPEYVWTDNYHNIYENKKPVFEHLQASRRFKSRIR